MQVLKSSLPPSSLAKQEQLLLGKRKKKFLEFQAPWNYFVRQESSSEALRFEGEVYLCSSTLLTFICSFSFERVWVYFRTTSSSRPVSNSCAIVLSYLGRTTQTRKLENTVSQTTQLPICNNNFYIHHFMAPDRELLIATV